MAVATAQFDFNSRGGAARLVRLGCDGLAQANVLGDLVLCQPVAHSQETVYDKMHECVRTYVRTYATPLKMHVLRADVCGQPRNAWGLGACFFYSHGIAPA